MVRQTLTHSRSFVEFLAITKQQSFTLGIDVHKNSYAVALRSENGSVWTCSGPANASWILQMIQRESLRVHTVVYEAGPTGFSTARAFHDAGIRCVVVAPAQILRPATLGAKTDRLDCQRLAELASHGMVHPIAIPTLDEESKRDLVRRRHDLVKSIRNAKLRIRSRLLFWGVEEPRGLENWSGQAIRYLRSMPIMPAYRKTMDSLLRELAFLKNEIKSVEKEITQCDTPKEKEIIGNLQTAPGVGPVVSATFYREIFRPERFPRSEEIGRYLGLAPVPRQSGESKGRARRIPSGQRILRGILVQAAWRWRSIDAGAAQYYSRIMSRCGLAQKAIVALSRKLAIILWRICIENRPYRPACSAG
jgi:transposase